MPNSEEIVNAFGRLSVLFGSLAMPGNPVEAELLRLQTMTDEVAMKLAERFGVDYGALVDANLQASTEHPTAADLHVLQTGRLCDW